MTFADRVESAATRMIAKLGRTATLTGKATLSTSTGQATAGEAVSTVATPPSVRRGYSNLAGAVVDESTVSYLLATVEPEVGGQLTFGSDTWKIVAVRKFVAGVDAAAYRVEVTS